MYINENALQVVLADLWERNILVQFCILEEIILLSLVLIDDLKEGMLSWRFWVIFQLWRM